MGGGRINVISTVYKNTKIQKFTNTHTHKYKNTQHTDMKKERVQYGRRVDQCYLHGLLSFPLLHAHMVNKHVTDYTKESETHRKKKRN